MVSEFIKLKDIKKENKKDFFSDLSNLIDKYSNVASENETNFEIY